MVRATRRVGSEFQQQPSLESGLTCDCVLCSRPQQQELPLREQGGWALLCGLPQWGWAGWQRNGRFVRVTISCQGEKREHQIASPRSPRPHSGPASLGSCANGQQRPCHPRSKEKSVLLVALLLSLCCWSGAPTSALMSEGALAEQRCKLRPEDPLTRRGAGREVQSWGTVKLER